MKDLNANIDRAAALAVLVASAFGLVAVTARLVAALRAGRGVDSALYEGLAGLRLDLWHRLDDSILRQDAGQYGGLWRYDLHGGIFLNKAIYALLPHDDKRKLNQKNLNDLVVNNSGKHGLPRAFSGDRVWLS